MFLIIQGLLAPLLHPKDSKILPFAPHPFTITLLHSLPEENLVELSDLGLTPGILR